MKAILFAVVVSGLLVGSMFGQDTGSKAPHNSTPTTIQADRAESDDMKQMRADLERLKVLLNQMRTNLAFVQTSQTPLKHQFELETDAWQVIVEQMERRLKHMEDRGAPASGR